MALIKHNVQLLSAFVDKHGDLFEWVKPTAGAIAFLRFKGGLSSTQLGDELATAGIGIKPAYCFTDLVTREKDFFRVGFGEEATPKAVEALAAFGKERRAGWRARMSRM